MRGLPILLVAIAAAGCASAHVGGHATVTQTITQTVGAKSDPLAKRAVAPRMWLRTRTRAVRAVEGSACVEYVRPDGQGASVCSDTPYPAPQQLVVLRPSDRVRFTLAGNHGFVVEVHKLGCDRRVLTRVRVASDGRWTVALRPGLYQVLVHVPRFVLGRRHGNTSGGFGLWVAPHKRRDVVPAASVFAPGC